MKNKDMTNRDIQKLQSFNPDKQFAKQRQTEKIMDNWYALPLEKQKEINPFAQILKETFDEPPYVPPVNLRTAKQRRNNNE